MNIESIVPVMKRASAWVIIWGIVTFVCGVLAIILPLTFSFGIALIIGCLVLVAAIAHLFFAFETRSVGGHFGTRPLFRSQTIPSLRLGAD
jgi:uncharacterized membrane protein HdeD (DUF308 family)